MNLLRSKISLVKKSRQLIAITLFSLLICLSVMPGFAQIRVSGARSGGKAAVNKKANKKVSAKKSKGRAKQGNAARISDDDGEREGVRIDVPAAAQVTVEQIMSSQAARGEYKTTRELLAESGVFRELEGPDRENLPEGGTALSGNQYPLPDEEKVSLAPQIAAQTLGTQFNGVTGPTETGAFPPDTEAEVGPTQVVVFVNGRLRTFNKTTGAADGVINVDPDVFFASVLTPPLAGEVVFTSDPNVRYDRISNRWYLNIIDVVLNAATGATTRANRILFAVSDAASNGNITAATVWTLYQFQGDATLFTDYQSIGIDASAMYIGADMFTLAGSFNSTKGFVIPKAPALTASPLIIWAFSGLVATPTGAGPFAPRGVDNPDPANTGLTALGYFIGVDNATFNTLMIRRVTNPGSLGPAPTISANISLATPLTTRFPVLVPHLGNTGGTGGRLDSLDDRLYSAMMRNGRLWTAHSLGVNNTGVAGATNNRNAARWYEIQNLNATPSVVQSGTVFDNNATNDANQRNYWIPTIAVSGQGHAALGSSIAGTNERINAFTTGRLVGDTLGTMREGPGGAAIPGYTASSTAYNPPSDPGGPSRRWGDYSATVVDPLDDMTMWTFQEYNNAANTYGVRAVKLIAPPPATPVPNSVMLGQASVNVVITGTQTNGSGFYDPGPNLAAPARPFNHIAASVSAGSNVVVNSVTYNSPTQITLNLNTTSAVQGARTLTVTNPDGQTGTGALTVVGVEGDISSRPNGDGSILSDDVVQIRRFLNGTNAADQTTDEFQRADSSPFVDRGDGRIFSDDVVQARRYQNGTNTKQLASGPMTQAPPRPAEMVDQLFGGLSKTVIDSALLGNPREVRVENAMGSAGQNVTVNIRVNAVGNESEYGFIINYDSTILSNPVVGAGTAGASVRSCNIATIGQVNCSVGGFPNNQMGSSEPGIGEIAAGTNQLLITVQFTIAANAQPGTTPLTLSNVNASSDAPQLLLPTATNGTVTILAPTAAPVSVSGRVTSIMGRGVGRARVIATNANGEVFTALTSSFGYYRFSNLPSGETYIFTVTGKGYSFSNSTQVINLNEERNNVNFVADK